MALAITSNKPGVFLFTQTCGYLVRYHGPGIRILSSAALLPVFIVIPLSYMFTDNIPVQVNRDYHFRTHATAESNRHRVNQAAIHQPFPILFEWRKQSRKGD